MMKRMATVVIVLASMALTSCSYSPFEGTVAGKEKDIQWISTGKSGYFTDRYELTVTDGESTDTWSVKKSVYKACSEGDSVERTEDGTVTCF